MKNIGLAFLIGIQMTLCLPSNVHAQEATCEQSQSLDKYQLLRRLSLDLRNQAPTYEEYLALDELDEVPEAWLDTWFEEDAFRLSMRRVHEALLWPNPTGVQFNDQETRLTSTRAQYENNTLSIISLASPQRRNQYRGDSSATCAARLQTDFDENGYPIAEPVYGENGSFLYFQEGYVMVSPHWAPNSTYAVCAFDAQTQAFDAAGTDCATPAAFRSPGCGCGPDMRWCYGPGAITTIWDDLREQFARSVDDVTVGGHPYHTLLTSKTQYMNGHLAYWKKHQAQMVNLNRTYNGQGIGDPEISDDISYIDEDWVAYERTDLHSGILTLPAFTLRFQTDRARANRFRIAFTHQYFIPPAQPEDPATSDCEEFSEDLTQMCTCRSCHQVLEPLAAHFASVIDAGSTLTTDLNEYEPGCDPTLRPEGQTLPATCRRLYEARDTAKNPGWLQTHQFAYIEDEGHNNVGLDDPLHQSIYDHILTGPEALAQGIIDSEQLATSTVRNMWIALMGRDVILDPTDDNNEIELLADLASSFQSDYDFQNLVKALVALPQYRRIR